MKWKKRGSEDTVEKVFLRNMGAESLDDINAWFKKSRDNNYRIDGIEEACNVIRKNHDKHIVIVGDYDADGCCATSILLLGLKAYGCRDVTFRIPKRFSEGFGISEKIVEEIPAGSLVITCDNGIAFPEVIKSARDKGCTVILTDHHLPKVDEAGNAVMPDADVIIDPNAFDGSADFNGYCGAGLCYRLVRELLKRPDHPVVRQALALAAIATVADVVPLREENYVIVRKGLKMLLSPESCTVGLTALLQELRLTDYITATDIGFSIAPCINACSRMQDDGAENAVRLLSYDGDDGYKASDMARRIINTNFARKDAKEKAIKAVEVSIKENGVDTSKPLVILTDAALGIIGIVAGYLTEKYEVPSIVLTDTGDGILHGSARSTEDFDIKAHLDKCAPLLSHYGGHPGAAGLTLKKSDFEKFTARFQSVSDDLAPALPYREYDLEIDASEIPAYAEELMKYAPFGEGNPDIVFKVRDFQAIPISGKYASFLGADGSTVKITDGVSDLIGFGMGDEFSKLSEPPKKLGVLATLGFNYFRGAMRPQAEFSDFALPSPAIYSTSLAEMLKKAAS